MYGTTFCDHIPLYFGYPVCTYAATNDVNIYHKADDCLVIHWDLMFDKNLRFYSQGLEFLLEDFFSRAISCKGINCSETDRTRDLDND